MAVSASLVKELRERTGLGMMECKKALAEAEGNIDTAIENLRKASGLKAAKKSDRTAAEGVIVVKLDQQGALGVMLEVNSETDFVARDDSFLTFASAVADNAFALKSSNLDEIVDSKLESSREELVQKIGENIGVRRAICVEPESGIVGSYVHSNARIGVLVQLSGGTVELAKDVAMHVAAVNPQVLRPEDMPEETLEKEKEIIKAQPDMAGKPDEIVEKMIGGRIKKFLKENSLQEQPFVKNPELTVGKLVKDGGAELIGFVRFEVGEGVEKKQEDFAAEVAAQVAASKK